jgi:hypothetical protein
MFHKVACLLVAFAWLPLPTAFDTVTTASAVSPWGWVQRGYDVRHSDYAPDLPPLPNSCYRGTPPVSVTPWTNGQALR